jgi:hypothetical protein
MSQTESKKRYVLFSLAIVLPALAAVAFLLGSSYPSVRPFAGLACIASVYLVRMSNVHRSQSLPDMPVAGVGFTEEKRQTRLLWIISLALVPLLGVVLFLMYVDAANGGHETWPAYVLFGVALVCAAVWGGLAAKISSSK